MDWTLAFTNISAPSPCNKSENCTLTVDKELVALTAEMGMNNKIFEMFYNVVGHPPPVNNIGYHEKGELKDFPDHWAGLRRAHALFKGIKRPRNYNGHAEKVHIYVMKPQHIYKYVAHMACSAKRIEAPAKAVFLVYAEFEIENCTHGTILNWEWVPADAEQPDLPDNHAERYDERIW